MEFRFWKTPDKRQKTNINKKNAMMMHKNDSFHSHGNKFSFSTRRRRHFMFPSRHVKKEQTRSILFVYKSQAEANEKMQL